MILFCLTLCFYNKLPRSSKLQLRLWFHCEFCYCTKMQANVANEAAIAEISKVLYCDCS